MFQPSPNLKAGCNSVIGLAPTPVLGVSTLTQPQGRVQRCSVVLDGGFGWFQPSPNLKAGCNILDEIGNVQQILFQPSPNLKAGCNAVTERLKQAEIVSTLTQPQGRVQR